MRILFSIIVVFSLFSCQSPKEEEEKKEYEVYQYSEMALYMNSIYEIHETLKKDILEGNKLSDTIPEAFLKIHTADFTKGFERDDHFESFSEFYLQQVTAIYDTASAVPLKDRYNNAINMCISCHQTVCMGPIPRIKKLLIN